MPFMVIVSIFQNLSLLPHTLSHLDNKTVLESHRETVESRRKGVQWLESVRHEKGEWGDAFEGVGSAFHQRESTIERLQDGHSYKPT